MMFESKYEPAHGTESILALFLIVMGLIILSESLFSNESNLMPYIVSALMMTGGVGRLRGWLPAGGSSGGGGGGGC